MRAKVVISISVLLLFLSACQGDEPKTILPPPDSNNIHELQSKIEKYPDSLIFVQNLIEAYRDAGNYDSALSLADVQIQKDSNNAYFWNIKANLYFENGDTLKAVHSLEQAIEIYPMPDYLIGLGTIYAEIKNTKALSIADELLKTQSKKLMKDAYFIKGLFYNFNNEPKNAIPFLDSCLKLDYTYMYAYREKAIAYYTLGNYKNAIEILKRAVTLRNNFDEAYFWMGKCYEKLDEKENAIQSYENALLYDKNYIEAKTALKKLKNK
jgi:tetratricopeptide (TPR) repeat protein